jgi:hypothetical protein
MTFAYVLQLIGAGAIGYAISAYVRRKKMR